MPGKEWLRDDCEEVGFARERGMCGGKGENSRYIRSLQHPL